MLSRCRNKNNKFYENYGGRGISVCEEWLSFKNFYIDMGHTPDGMTLDRIDNNKGYCKENCQWRSRSDQSKNRRCARLITSNGVTKNMADWAEEIGIDERTIWNRLKLGWTEQESVTLPKVTKRKGIPNNEKLRYFQN